MITMMPIMGAINLAHVPMSLLEPMGGRAMVNHSGQTLQRLATRGGLCCSEALAILKNKPWDQFMDYTAAELELLGIVDAYTHSPEKISFTSEGIVVS